MRIRAVVVGVLLIAGCRYSDESDEQKKVVVEQVPASPQQPNVATGQPADTLGDVRLEVSLAERKLYVYRGGQPTDTYPVAVGTEKWPTPKGEWTIEQVIFNPRWVPPKEESWAEDRETKEPGEPGNPLGAAQLVYRLPNSIHGTNHPESVGKAASHGSIRMRNEDIVKLAQLVMAAGGAAKDSAWVAQAQANKSEKQDVQLPRPVPITVR